MDGGRRWRWKQVFRYSRCLCFGCKDQQLTSYIEEETNDSDDSSSRRGGISYQRTDKKALYVRMLGDVKTQTKPELTKEYKNVRRKSGSLQSEAKLLDRLDCSTAKRARLTQRRLSSSSTNSSSGGGGGNSCRGARTKRLSAMTMSRDCANLLDVQYMTLAMKCMSSIHKWNFDVFTLDLLTDGRSLFHLSLHLFFDCGFIGVFQLDVVLLMRCLALIESGYYFSNPYHNSVHAADVVQAMYCNLQEPQISKHLRPIEKMAAIIAAASHDLDHPGVNQAFLIATANPLAALYNNISVLENHHWHAMIGILHESRVFEHVDRNTWNELLMLTQSLILATDITRQQEILGLFRDHLNRGSLDLHLSSSHRSFILQITLKCADICNPCRPWPLSKRWSEMICEEFFRQGDCESKLGLPVAPFNDRHKSTVSTIQTGFIANVVEPLFIEWGRFLGSELTSLQLSNLRTNRLKWEEIIAQEKLQAQTITVVACTEKTASSTAVEIHREVHYAAVELNVEVGFNSLVDDKENANPVLNDADLIDILTHRLGRNGHRRHSLPSDRIGEDPVFSAYCVTSLQNRRHSLPNCERNGERMARRLSSLVECSPVGEDHFDFDNNLNLRHATPCDNSENCSLKSAENPELIALDRRRSEIVQIGFLFPEEVNANRRRASCPLNAVNRIYHQTSSKINSSSPETGYLLRQQSCFVAPVLSRRPLSSKRVTDCSGILRKFSLTLADDLKHTAAADRKRSCSLATSTLLYPVDENLSRLKSLITNTMDDIPCWQQPGKSIGLLHDLLLERCESDDRVNHFITSDKLLKPPVLSIVTNTRCQAENISGTDVYSSERVASPSGIKVGHGQTFQVHCPPRPVISRTVDVHSRPPKGVTRKATSVFSSISDGEVAPLLPKRVDLHSCDDEV